MNPPVQRQRSPWVYIGIGCGALVLLSVVAVVVASVLVVKKASDWGKEMSDPVARAERVKKVLGAKELPPGYHAIMSFSLPLVMDIALLGDKPPDEKGQVSFGRRGFLYYEFLAEPKDPKKLRDYFEGKTDDPSALRQNNVQIEVKEIIERGVIQTGAKSLLYLSQRGRVETGGAGANQGLSTLLLFQCPADQKMRMGIWFGEDPSPQTPVAEADFGGTVADKKEIETFVGYFDPCH